jgi:hypothetical protein
MWKQAKRATIASQRTLQSQALSLGKLRRFARLAQILHCTKNACSG